MYPSIINEYVKLFSNKEQLNNSISELPKGYISNKRINGKDYKYLQSRENDKIVSNYIKAEDADVLINLAGIKEEEVLRKAEADITGIAMMCMYNFKYDKFNADTLKDIHKSIFGQIYSWAGEFRTIQLVKPEYVLGGDTVRE